MNHPILQTQDSNLTTAEEYIMAIDIITRVVSSIGCAVMIIIIFLLKYHREHVGRMLMFITVTGTLASFPFYLIFTESCFIPAMIDHYSFVSLALWATCFAVQLMLVLSALRLTPKRALIIFLVVCQLLPTTLLIFTLLNKNLHPTENQEPNCWQTLSDNKIKVFEIAPVILCACVALVLAVIARKKLELLRQHIHVSNENLFGIMLQIPIYFLVLWTPAICISIINQFETLNSIFIEVGAMLPNFLPLLITISYVFSAKVRHGLRKLISNRKIPDSMIEPVETRKDVTLSGTVISNNDLTDSLRKASGNSANEMVSIETRENPLN